MPRSRTPGSKWPGGASSSRRRSSKGRASAPPPADARRIGLAVLGGIALVSLVVLAAGRGRRSEEGLGGASGPIGPADGCRAQPRFVRQLQLGEQAGFTTGWAGTIGLAIVDPTADGGRGWVYQHPSWSSAGHLGPHVTDRFGNLYLAPFPRGDFALNPPGEQSRVYRVDTDRQELSLLVELEPGRPPDEVSPIGVVGLAYDCDTDSLYATSLAGSTAGEEVGRIYRIDLRRGEVADTYQNLDAAGVAVYRTAKGKRLLLGLTRQPRLVSLALDQRGSFVGQPRPEVDLSKDAHDGRTTAYQIRFPEPQVMELALVDFRGGAASTARGEVWLPYAYDATADRWQRQP